MVRRAVHRTRDTETCDLSTGALHLWSHFVRRYDGVLLDEEASRRDYSYDGPDDDYYCHYMLTRSIAGLG